MFKVRCNNKIIGEHNSLLEAKMNTLLTLKKNPELRLIEVLDDNDEVVFSKEEPTQEQVDVGVDTVLRNLISRCWETITELESAKVTFIDNNVSEETLNILDQMVNDNYQQIGELESCLSDNIEQEV